MLQLVNSFTDSTGRSDFSPGIAPGAGRPSLCASLYKRLVRRSGPQRPAWSELKPVAGPDGRQRDLRRLGCSVGVGVDDDGPGDARAGAVRAMAMRAWIHGSHDRIERTW